jgi:stage II sporulation protein D
MNIKKIIIAVMMLVPALVSLEAGVWDSMKGWFSSKEETPPPTIKVLIAHDKEASMIEVKGKYHIYDPYAKSKLTTRFLGKSHLMQPLMAGLKWGEEFPGVYQLYILPDEPSTTILVDGIEYKGAVYIYDIGGTLSIVNEVPIEDYISSIAAKENEISKNSEVLAAVAIIERTNAYYNAHNSASPYWNVDAQKVGYQGQAAINPQSPMEQAISSTRHMVMSSTGTYEGVITPFSVSWSKEGGRKNGQQTLSLQGAEAMAAKGDHAATILSRTFPNSSIQLIYVEKAPEIAPGG